MSEPWIKDALLDWQHAASIGVHPSQWLAKNAYHSVRNHLYFRLGRMFDAMLTAFPYTARRITGGIRRWNANPWRFKKAFINYCMNASWQDVVYLVKSDRGLTIMHDKLLRFYQMRNEWDDRHWQMPWMEEQDAVFDD